MFFQTENPSVPESGPRGRVDSDDMVICTPTAPPVAQSRQKSSAQINLMTPESFQSPPEKESPGQGVPSAVLSTIRMLAASANAPVGDKLAAHETIKSIEMRMSSSTYCYVLFRIWWRSNIYPNFSI